MGLPGPLEIMIMLAFTVLIFLLFIILLAVLFFKFIKQTIKHQAREEMLRFKEEIDGQGKNLNRIKQTID